MRAVPIEQATGPGQKSTRAIPIQPKAVPGQKSSRAIPLGKTATVGTTRVAGRKLATTDPRYRQIIEVAAEESAEEPKKAKKTKSKSEDKE